MINETAEMKTPAPRGGGPGRRRGWGQRSGQWDATTARRKPGPRRGRPALEGTQGGRTHRGGPFAQPDLPPTAPWPHPKQAHPSQQPVPPSNPTTPATRSLPPHLPAGSAPPPIGSSRRPGPPTRPRRPGTNSSPCQPAAAASGMRHSVIQGRTERLSECTHNEVPLIRPTGMYYRQLLPVRTSDSPQGPRPGQNMQLTVLTFAPLPPLTPFYPPKRLLPHLLPLTSACLHCRHQPPRDLVLQKRTVLDATFYSWLYGSVLGACGSPWLRLSLTHARTAFLCESAWPGQAAHPVGKLQVQLSQPVPLYSALQLATTASTFGQDFGIDFGWFQGIFSGSYAVFLPRAYVFVSLFRAFHSSLAAYKHALTYKTTANV